MIRIGTVIDAAPVGHAVTVMLEGETEYSLAWAKCCPVRNGDRVVCDTSGTSLIVLANMEPSPLAGVAALDAQTATFTFAGSAVSDSVEVTFSPAFAAAPGAVRVFTGAAEGTVAHVTARSQGSTATWAALQARQVDGVAITATVTIPVLLTKTY